MAREAEPTFKPFSGRYPQGAVMGSRLDQDQDSARVYFAFGLCIRSKLPLPELAEIAGETPVAVDVCLGPVPVLLPDVRCQQGALQVSAEAVLITVPGVARYQVCAGKRIIVDPAPGASERNVRLYLLGSAFGALCHQLGMLPLHANAIEIDGLAYAFAGISGAGKSTLAAYFQGKNYNVLTDDICVVTFPEGKPPVAWPGIPRLRIWRDTVEALGRNTADLEQLADGFEKYHLPLQKTQPLRGLPLSRIYILSAPDSGAEIVQLRGAAAFEAVVEQTYRRECLALIDLVGLGFARNVRLLASVPVFRVGWRKDFAVFAEAAARLEDHVRN